MFRHTIQQEIEAIFSSRKIDLTKEPRQFAEMLCLAIRRENMGEKGVFGLVPMSSSILYRNSTNELVMRLEIPEGHQLVLDYFNKKIKNSSEEMKDSDKEVKADPARLIVRKQPYDSTGTFVTQDDKGIYAFCISGSAIFSDQFKKDLDKAIDVSIELKKDAEARVKNISAKDKTVR